MRDSVRGSRYRQQGRLGSRRCWQCVGLVDSILAWRCSSLMVFSPRPLLAVAREIRVCGLFASGINNREAWIAFPIEMPFIPTKQVRQIIRGAVLRNQKGCG